MDEASFFSLLTIPPSLPDRANASKFIAETLTQSLRKLNSLIFQGYEVRQLIRVVQNLTTYWNVLIDTKKPYFQ